MKYLLLVILIPLLNTVEPVEDVQWKTDFPSAQKEAKKSQKNVLVYFTGSDWCGPCIQLKKDLFVKKEFIELSQAYVMVYIDIPRKKNILSAEQLEHNMNLLPKLNKKGIFPYFIILAPDEEIVDDLSGYAMDGKTQRHLRFLEKNK